MLAAINQSTYDFTLTQRVNDSILVKKIATVYRYEDDNYKKYSPMEASLRTVERRRLYHMEADDEANPNRIQGDSF